jgi:hypothetical protein
MSRRSRLVCAGLLGAFSACTYAWPTGTSPLDAGADGPTDASPDHAPDVVDAPTDTATDAPKPNDGGPDSAPNCAKLLSEIALTRDPAKKCQQGTSFCAVAIKDECNCDTFIDEAGTQNVAAYQAAVAAFVAATCADPGKGFCPRVGGCNVASHVCIIEPEAGFGTYCFPQ